MIGHIPWMSGSPHGVTGCGEPSAYLRAAAGCCARASPGSDNAARPAVMAIKVRTKAFIILSSRSRAQGVRRSRVYACPVAARLQPCDELVGRPAVDHPIRRDARQARVGDRGLGVHERRAVVRVAVEREKTAGLPGL